MTENHDELMGPTDARKMVEDGYDQLAERYAEVRTLSPGNKKYIDMLARLLPKDSCVLDLGCGPGVPITKELVRHFKVVGIDFSSNQIELARKNVRIAEFHRMDMTKMTFPPNSFDGIFSYLAIIHVPREEKASLFSKIHEILKPGGFLLIAIGCDDWVSEPGDDFMGEPMYWSQFGAEKTKAMIKDTGFEIIQTSKEYSIFDGEEEKHYFVLAKKKESLECLLKDSPIQIKKY